MKTSIKDAKSAADITTAAISFRIRLCFVVNMRFSHIMSEGSLAAFILIGLTPGIKTGKFLTSSFSEAAVKSLNLCALRNDSSFSSVTKAEHGLVSF